MNITFLIGNGFDIACGMQTSYSSFLEYYTAFSSKDTEIEEFRNLIKSHLEDWSDAEMAIGRVTEKFQNRLTAYRKCYDDFVDYMSRYLEIQQKQFIDKKILFLKTSSFKSGVLNFYEKIPTAERPELIDKIKRISASSSSSTVDYNFLIFNYTNTFSSFVNEITDQERNIQAVNPKVFSGLKIAKLKEIGYAHGRLSDPPLVMGVDNGAQIANIDFRNDLRLTRSLVKSESNNAIRKNEFNHCINILGSSNIICIYGMSLGQTDGLWWDEIRKWMASNSLAILLIFWWDPTCKKSSVGSCLEARERFELVLGQNLGFSENELIMMKNRIFVAINSNPFGL